jgi:thiamine-phosphate pyrophosphorylase
MIEYVPLTPADIPLLHAWLARPHVAEWWGSPSSLEELEREFTYPGPAFGGSREARGEAVVVRLEVTVRLFLPTDLGIASLPETLRRARRVLELVTDASEVVFGVRDHAESVATRLALARALLEIARPRGARVVVHDRIDLALAASADGVQLGERSIGVGDARALLGTASFVGRSCHDLAGLLAARDAGADAATLSPLFASPGKGSALGVAAFAELRAAVPSLPIIALGGIDATNARTALAAGADGVAALRAWLRDDVDAFVRSVGDADETP